jgi:hypothetical protein
VLGTHDDRMTETPAAEARQVPGAALTSEAPGTTTAAALTPTAARRRPPGTG